MEPIFKIVTEGKLREGINRDDFIQSFTKTFGVSAQKARSLLDAGRLVTLKENLDRLTAEKYRRVLQDKIGLIVRIEEVSMPGQFSSSYDDKDSTRSGISHATVSEGTQQGARCPKCGSDRVSDDNCLACGIIISRYQVRHADSSQSQNTESNWNPYQTTTTTDSEDEMPGDIRAVSAGDAWQWVVGGWHLFVRNPFVWIATIIIWYIMMFIAGLIPFIGSLAVNIFSPVFIAGLMLGASEQSAGGDLKISHLFEGFSTEFGKLIQAGLLYLAATVGVMIVAGIFLFIFGMGSFMLNSGGIHAVSGFSFFAIFFLIMIVLIAMAMLGMAFYFVPLLIVFEGMNPVPAMQKSFSACWKNWLPFLVYSLILAGLGVLAIIPVGLGLFVLGPVIIASIYVSYRHIFHGEM